VGWGIVAVSAAVALITAFALRTRLPAVIVTVVLAGAGAGLGWGGMLIQADPSTGEEILAVALTAVLVPAHVRLVLGRFGPAGRGQGIRAMADPAGPPR
jgi:hypothetical protein